MKVTLETLAAIYKISVHLASADGQVSSNEVQHLFDFFQKFEGLSQDTVRQLMDYGEKMDPARALQLIANSDEEAKQEIANVFARIVCEDEFTDQEKDLYFKISEYCGLPDPVGDIEPEDEEEEYEDDEEEEEEEIDEEDCIVPAFFVVNYHGMVRTQQSEAEDWDTLGKLLAKWIRADRVEIVRFTPPLNALTRELELNNRHLVFMVSRNGYDEEVGDNMPATILYGGGYPIYGNVVFALETDDGYEIEGFRSRSLLSEALDAVNDAVDGLLRFPD